MPEVKTSRDLRVQSRHPVLIAVWVALATAYLATSASGMRVVSMAVVGLMVGALLAASGRPWAGALAGAALAALCLSLSDSMRFIAYAPPLAAFLFMAFFFYRTLRPGSEPLIARVARREHPDLPPEMARHARMLTWAWSLCFMLLFAVSLLLAPLLQLDAWSRWVHGLGYVLPGALFIGEYAYRHVRFPDRQHGSLRVLIPNIVAVSKEAALPPRMRDVESGE